ncbi:MAG TPA: ankyrin repeat domain-containing protein [Thermoanaerobaculia bacterium]|nr:ankyrin repeat domain-containing protein [Thermoanaerobaculia bacterium]
MYPNPQDAVPLPPRSNLGQYRKLAKDLVRACRADDPDAVGDWTDRWLERLARLQPPAVRRRHGTWIRRRADQVEEFARSRLSGKCSLTEAQFVIARAHGFLSWPKLARHIEGLGRRASSVSRFERAADAIVEGDAATLKRLLREEPELIRTRSAREHGATLLHYVSANGVEGHRQKTPKNIARIAEILLEAGAEVDAEADVYGGGATTLGLAATSCHPRDAGVQIPLLETLLGHGARIDQPGAGHEQSAVLGCLANGRPEAAEFLASRGARLGFEEAAGVGRLDVVRGFFEKDGRRKPGLTKERMDYAFRMACGYGRKNVVEFLLDRGADVASQGPHGGMTALHMAAIGGHPDIVRWLLQQNAPLEVVNVYGGTVLGQTLWSAAHGGDPEAYAEILEALIAAGAKLEERHPPINSRIDDLLLKHGSRPDKTLWWYGEKPRIPRTVKRGGARGR